MWLVLQFLAFGQVFLRLGIVGAFDLLNSVVERGHKLVVVGLDKIKNFVLSNQHRGQNKRKLETKNVVGSEA